MKHIAQTARIASFPAASGPPRGETRFILRSLYKLPIVDLSKTLQSELLSPSWSAAVDLFVRTHARRLWVAYFVTSLLHTTILFVSPVYGRVLSIFAAFAGLPGVVFILFRLRADVVRALIRTFDIVFSIVLISVTLGVLSVMLNDARAIVIFEAWLATFINIFVDANIQAMRQIVFINCFALISVICLLLVVVFDILPGITNFDIVTVGPRTLTARNVVSNGLGTMLAVLARNTYRNRGVLFNRSSSERVDCVSYRCRLQLCAVEATRKITGGDKRHRPGDAENVQPMLFVPVIDKVDSANVLCEPLCRRLVMMMPCVRISCSVIGCVAFTLALGGGVLESTSLFTSASIRSTYAALMRWSSMSLTLIYCICCASNYHTKLLRVLGTSFDFQFFAIQITFIHVALADFVGWNSSCQLLVVTWLWAVWILCLDTLTPSVRWNLGIRWWFVRLVWSTLIGSLGLMVYIFLFTSVSTSLHDRVLWQSVTASGQVVEFRMFTSFCSVVGTVVALSVRVWWRVWHATGHQLIMIDSPVCYINFLSAGRQRQPGRPSMRAVSVLPSAL